jgi:hypothetical protein
MRCAGFDCQTVKASLSQKPPVALMRLRVVVARSVEVYPQPDV